MRSILSIVLYYLPNQRDYLYPQNKVALRHMQLS